MINSGLTTNEFSHKLAMAIKTKYDPEKGTLTSFITSYIKYYSITDKENKMSSYKYDGKTVTGTAYHTVYKNGLISILLVEKQNTLYSIDVYDMNKTMASLEIPNLTSKEFETLIVKMAEVYSYQHPGKDLDSLKKRINDLL